MGPLLFYIQNSKLDTLIPQHFYIHPRIHATNEFVELLRFAGMSPLTWAPTLTGGYMSSNWEGVITIHEILGRGLSSKDHCNPFVKVFFGDTKMYKAKKIMKTINPHWEDLSWKM